MTWPILVLVTLCLVAIVISVVETLRIAYRAQEVVESLDAVERNAGQVAREMPLAELERGLMQSVASQTVRDRIRSLSSLRASGSHVDPVALAQGTAETFHQRLAIPRVMANVMVLLGLLGAVYGITFVCSQLAEIIPKYEIHLSDNSSIDLPGLIKNQNQMLNEMAEALRGTSSAFSLSMVGIAGTVAVLITLVMASSRVDHALSRLELMTQQTLLSLFSPMLEASAQARMVEAFLESARVLTEVSEGMREKAALVKDQIDDLYIVVRTFRDGAASLTQLSGHLDGLQDLIRTSQTDLARTMEALAGQVRSLGEGQRADLESLLGGLGEQTQAAVKKVVDQLGHDLGKSREQMAGLVSGLLSGLADLQTTQTLEFREKFNQQHQLLHDQFKSMDPGLLGKQLTSTLTVELERFSTRALTDVERILKAQQQDPAVLTKALERIGQNLQELGQEAQQQQVVALERIAQGLDRQSQSLTKLLPRVETPQTTPDLEELLRSQNRHLEEMASSLRARPSEAAPDEGLRELVTVLRERRAPPVETGSRGEDRALRVLAVPILLASGYLLGVQIFGGPLPSLLVSGALCSAAVLAWKGGP